jgi:hypothetical protein
MTTIDLPWEEPPASTVGAARPSRWTKVAAALRERPGQWALVRTDSRSTADAANVRRGTIAAFRPAGAFEAKSRVNADGTFSIWARYNPAA